MKSFNPICIGFALSMMASAAAADKKPEDIAQQYVDQWIAAHDAADAEKLTNLYSPDAVLMPDNSPAPLVGTDAINTYLQGLLRDPGKHLRITNQSVRQIGDDVIYASGQWSEEIPSGPVKGLFLYILQRREGDAWRAVADTWNHHD